MNPPLTTRRPSPDAAGPEARAELSGRAAEPLSADELLADLDPGWLDWRAGEDRA